MVDERHANRAIRVVTLCSGYDAQCLALERLRRNYPDFDYELIAWAEIDEYAIKAHDVLFPEYAGRNMGDITSCDWSGTPSPIDLLTYSTPCQSISSAGKQEGLKKGSGTASSIIWSVLNAIDMLRPRYLLMENVKALVSSKFIGDFRQWQDELAGRGYTNFVKVLNSKDFGVPQNRERVFMVSILNSDETYHFPEPFPLEKRLKDILEEGVDEKYYLSKKLMDYVESKGGKSGEFDGRDGIHDVRDDDEYAYTICANYYKTPCQGNYLKEPIACAMRNREVQCLTPKRTEYGKSVRKEYESGELRESRHNIKQIEPKILSYSRDGNGKVVNRHLKKVANTIHGGTGGGGNTDCYVVEPCNPYKDGTCRTLKAQYYKNGMANFIRDDGLGATAVKVFEPRIYQVGNIANGGSFNNPQRGRVYAPEGISPTIDTMGCVNLEPKTLCEYANYRIRKLTERECFRLQGVDDADIDKIQAAGISRSQQYKMAGNSITLDVLFHIFRKLFIEKQNESIQLTLF